MMVAGKGRVLNVLLILTLSGSIQATEKDVVVTLKHGGRLQGSVLNNTQGDDFYAFRGIPYAEPPIGELRFKAPVPKAAWADQILDATKDGPMCVQSDLVTSEPHGQEDCLTINVYTRQLPGVDKTGNANSAVMIFIHGGAFLVGKGSSKSYSPTMLMNEDIVLVTFNYRLGALGFLSTGDEASPGNYGMLDQTLALKWVQENIEAFGGDADRVTIFGESAGAVSVSHHVLSPLSKGLFHRAIAMSGASTCSWAINEHPSYWAKRLAKDAGCPEDSSQKLVDCLRQTNAEDIVNLTRIFMEYSFFPLPFSPIVDGVFLPDHPLKLLRTPSKLNQVPVISGVTKDEGGFFMAHIYFGHPGLSLTSPEVLTNVIGDAFGSAKPINEVTTLVKETYFSDVDATNETQVRSALIDAISDGLFKTGHYETISMMSKAGLRTFAYSYDHKTDFSYAQVFGAQETNWGVVHGNDLFMLFPLAGPLKKEEDKDMSKTMIKLWTNFANHGIPNPQNDPGLPKWPSIENDALPVLHLNDPTTMQTFDLMNDKSYNFWTTDIRKARTRECQHVYKEEP